MPEMAHREPREAVLELGTSDSKHGNDSASLTATVQPRRETAAHKSRVPPLAGPLPTPSDLYPSPPPESSDVPTAPGAEETDFEYQCRRLKVKRALVAERKRLAEEEEHVAKEEEAVRRNKELTGVRNS